MLITIQIQKTSLFITVQHMIVLVHHVIKNSSNTITAIL